MKCCEVNAGMLREVISFEAQFQRGFSDGMGGSTENWVAVASAPTRGHVKEVGGRESFHLHRQQTVADVVILTRYSASVNEGQRVNVRGEPYAITRVENIEMRDKFLRIYAKRGKYG